jgi:hypothetical protein
MRYGRPEFAQNADDSHDPSGFLGTLGVLARVTFFTAKRLLFEVNERVGRGERI